MKDELQTAVETLGLEKFRRHIFLCVDADEPKCCQREQSLAAWEFLKARLKELNLVGPNPLVFRTRANCLRVCVRGPSRSFIPKACGITVARRQLWSASSRNTLSAGKSSRNFPSPKIPCADRLFCVIFHLDISR